MGFFDFLSSKRKIEERKNKLMEELNLFIEQIKIKKKIEPITTDLFLKEGENAYLSESVTLLETRAVRHHVTGGGGFRVMRGVYVGGASGTSESKDEWRVIDKGFLTLTNERLIFDGNKEDRIIPLKKIISVKASLDSIEISTETRKKSMLFTVNNPLIWGTVIQVLIKNGPNLEGIDDIKINILSEK